MKRHKLQNGLLKLETLEDRTLLASLFHEADFTDAFVTVQSVEFSFESASFDSQDDEVAVWRGNGEAELTVYADKLPRGIDALKFFGFSSVKIVGQDELGLVTANSVDHLIIEARHSLEVEGSEGRLFAVDVNVIEYSGSTPEYMFLKGDVISVIAPHGIGGDNSWVYVRANELTIETQRAENTQRLAPIELTQVPGSDGSPLILSLVNVDPASFSLRGDFTGKLDGEEVTLVSGEISSSEELRQLREAIRLLDQNRDLFDSSEFVELRAALVELATSAAELEDFEGSNADGLSQLAILEGMSVDIPENVSLVGEREGSARLAESEIEIRTIQPELELRETETGLKVFVISDTPTKTTSEALGGDSLTDGELENQLSGQVRSAESEIANSRQSKGSIDQLITLLSRTQSAGEALRNHLMNKLSDELTPGGQTGLLVDGSRGVLRKDFIQRDL